MCITRRCSSCQPVFQAAEDLLSPLPRQSALSNKAAYTAWTHFTGLRMMKKRVAPGETLCLTTDVGLQFPGQPCPGLTAQPHTVPTLLVSRWLVLVVGEGKGLKQRTWPTQDRTFGSASTGKTEPCWLAVGHSLHRVFHLFSFKNTLL